MLKIALVDEEVRGNHLMTWWGGRGAAPVLEHDGRAILLERATGIRSLAVLAETDADGDDRATLILCATGLRLHELGPPAAAAELTPLTRWFADLIEPGGSDRALPASREAGEFQSRAASLARQMLSSSRESVVLHGDLHHGNVLDFAEAGWLAIDPKGLVGDPAFEFANILCNPTPSVAVRQGRVARQSAIIAEATGIDLKRIVAWTVAYCGLSSVWSAQDHQSAAHTLAVGLAAESLLG